MITIFQIPLTDEQVDAYNAGQAVPSLDAKRKLMFGPKGFNPSMLKYFRAVAEVHTDDLEKAFGATNIPTGIIVDKIWQMSSSSVGDIFEKDDRYYMVDKFGFKELALFKDEVESIGEAV